MSWYHCEGLLVVRCGGGLRCGARRWRLLRVFFLFTNPEFYIKNTKLLKKITICYHYFILFFFLNIFILFYFKTYYKYPILIYFFFSFFPKYKNCILQILSKQSKWLNHLHLLSIGIKMMKNDWGNVVVLFFEEDENRISTRWIYERLVLVSSTYEYNTSAVVKKKKNNRANEELCTSGNPKEVGLLRIHEFSFIIFLSLIVFLIHYCF